MSITKRGRSARYVAICLASLCIFAQLAGSAHLFMVGHALCPEHGELIHTGGEALSPAATATLAHPARALLGSASARDHHEHEHCFLASHRVQPLSRTGRVAVTAQPPANTTPSGALPARAPAPLLALLLLAPKTSPPV